MVNSRAITQFESFYANSAQAFDNNQEAFENNVRRYLQLKEMLQNRDVSLFIDTARPGNNILVLVVTDCNNI